MLTCPSAWTPAPADATVPFSSACYKASGYAISLRECVERCALDGAAPVCPASAAENNFVSSVALFTGINYLWLGVYRNASGIDRCVTGVDSDYTSYSIQFGQPDNVYGLEHCTYQYTADDVLSASAQHKTWEICISRRHVLATVGDQSGILL